jgi:hypothetical protein
MAEDNYHAMRCVVCGHEWVGTEGGKDHPPAALWAIMPHGWAPRPYDPVSMIPYQCHATMPSVKLRVDVGVILSACAMHRPWYAGEVPDSDAVWANLGEGSFRNMRLYTSEVCPVGKTPPPLLDRGEPPVPHLKPSANGFHEGLSAWIDNTE